MRDQVAPRIGEAPDTPAPGIAEAIARIEVEPERLRIVLRRKAQLRSASVELKPKADSSEHAVLDLPIRCKLRGGQNWIVPPKRAAAFSMARHGAILIRRLRQAHRVAAEMGWRMADGGLDELDRNAPASPYHRELVRLAFLAPDLQQAIIDGLQPVDLSLKRLMNEPTPISWNAQRRLYGAV